MEYKMPREELYTINEIELAIHRTHPLQNRPRIHHSRDADELLRYVWDEGKMELMEQCKVILMNRAGKVIGILNLSDGGINNCSVDVRLVLCAALKAGATRLILAHNHPSGETNPSAEDKALTTRLHSAAQLLNISLDDHVILTADRYLSFADEGLM